MPAAATPLTVTFAGDVMTGRGIDQVLARPGSAELHEPVVHDATDYVALAERRNGPIGRALPPEALWGTALDYLHWRRPDLFVVNLETAITCHGRPWPGKWIHYRMHPANVDALTAAGVQVCSLANNHVLDWGHDGLCETLEVLHGHGVQVIGAGRNEQQAWQPVVWQRHDGASVRLLACATASSGVDAEWAAGPERAGVAWLADLSRASLRRVEEALAGPGPAASLTVLSIHWGENWPVQVVESQRRFARELIDRGLVDVVHGHSSHAPMPVEAYRHGLILHGCGDLIDDYEGIVSAPERSSDLAALYTVTMDPASRRLQTLEALALQRQRFRLQAPSPAVLREAIERWQAGDAPWQLQPVPGVKALQQALRPLGCD